MAYILSIAVARSAVRSQRGVCLGSAPAQRAVNPSPVASSSRTHGSTSIFSFGRWTSPFYGRSYSFGYLKDRECILPPTNTRCIRWGGNHDTDSLQALRGKVPSDQQATLTAQDTHGLPHEAGRPWALHREKPLLRHPNAPVGKTLVLETRLQGEAAYSQLP